MTEETEKKQYLDLDGLKAYDAKIKAHVLNKLASAGHLKRKKVDTLPSVSEADDETIYFVKRTSGSNTSDAYNEYMLMEGQFELIGNTVVSFDGMATEEFANAAAAAAKAEAIAAAAQDATNKANTAKSEAIEAVAQDVEEKVGGVKTELVGSEDDTEASDTIEGAKKYADKVGNDVKQAAASDASTKASTAKTEAITAAAQDATSKANTAESNAKKYVDEQLGNFSPTEPISTESILALFNETPSEGTPTE